MEQFAVHHIRADGLDTGVMIFENGEKAIYSNKKIAQKIADGMNTMVRKLVAKNGGIMRHEYIVMEAQQNE